jgi:hypothetical protein
MVQQKQFFFYINEANWSSTPFSVLKKHKKEKYTTKISPQKAQLPTAVILIAVH